MFRYQGNHVPNISSFEDAVRAYDKARPWRDGRTERKLGSSDKDYHGITITLDNDGIASVGLRYHRTVVVEYFRSGDIGLRPYPSGSTDEFCVRSTPSDMNTNFNRYNRTHGCYLIKLSNDPHRGSSWWGDDNQGRIYALNSNAVTPVLFYRDEAGLLQPRPTSTMPWEMPVLDKQAARIALKGTQYSKLSDWLRAAWAMRREYKASEPALWQHSNDTELVHMLADRSSWTQFLTSHAYRVHTNEHHWAPKRWGVEPISINDRERYINACINKTLNMVRIAVYRAADVVHVEKHAYLPSLNEVEKYEKLQARYSWL